MPTLTPDQRNGARFLARNRCAYLADVPGLGKTAQYIRAADYLNTDTFTVICPPVIRSKIQGELDLWSHYDRNITTVVTKRDVLPQSGPVAVSYALASVPEIHAQLMARKPGPLILDEAHMLKNHDARRSLSILGRGGLASRATNLWWISGTPAPNNAGELFTFARLSGAWRGSWEAYCRAYCITKQGKYGKVPRVVGSKNEDALRKLLEPYFLRRTVVEGRPELAVDTIAVDGHDEYASLAAEHADAIKAALEHDDWSLPEVDAMSTVRRLIGLAKVPSTIGLARAELKAGHDRLLIFGTHIDVLKAIAEGLGPCAAVLNGSTSPKLAEELTAQFQRPGGTMVLCVNMVSGGAGLTLTRASRVLIPEPSWVPSENQQAIARAWRRGQGRPVHASFISIAGSLDDMIARTVARKIRELEKLLGDT